eukprot:4499387-Prymnesium_polylepis.1
MAGVRARDGQVDHRVAPTDDAAADDPDESAPLPVLPEHGRAAPHVRGATRRAPHPPHVPYRASLTAPQLWSRVAPLI